MIQSARTHQITPLFLNLGGSQECVKVHLSEAITYPYKIWASTNCVKVGDTLHVRGRLTNNSSGTRVFQVKDKPVFDIGVGFGTIRPSWSDGKALTTDLTRLELKPFESRTLEMDWVATGTVLTGSAALISLLAIDLLSTVG